MPVTIDMRRDRRGDYAPVGDLPVDRGGGLGQVTAPQGPGIDLGKPQAIRLADIAVFGPMMIYSGLGKKMPRWLRWGIIIVGVGTVIYNLHYYILNRAAQAPAPGLEGMQAGPWSRVADQYRPGRLRR